MSSLIQTFDTVRVEEGTRRNSTIPMAARSCYCVGLQRPNKAEFDRCQGHQKCVVRSEGVASKVDQSVLPQTARLYTGDAMYASL